MTDKKTERTFPASLDATFQADDSFIDMLNKISFHYFGGVNRLLVQFAGAMEFINKVASVRTHFVKTVYVGF
jgi:hypothetical protein